MEPSQLQHNKIVSKPWGTQELLGSGTGFRVKRLTVEPRQRLSLRRHRYRDEYWMIAHGIARVIVGNEELMLRLGETVYLPALTEHRVQNMSSIAALEIVELQVGSYLSEDDIVGVDDDYDRADVPVQQRMVEKPPE